MFRYGQAKIKMKALLICIFLISVNSLYACNCGKIADLKTQQERALANSSLIFIGDVISVDTDNDRYIIKIIEVL
jgi:hypothetical protein